MSASDANAHDGLAEGVHSSAPSAPTASAAEAASTEGSAAIAGAMDGAWGTIRLDPDACTSCMLCARECPDWCIHIDSHAVTEEAEGPGARPRTVHVLDRFAIDFGLCMYCGICIEVCPFDALAWDGDGTATAVVPADTSPAVAAGALVHEIDLLAPIRLT